MGWRAQSTKLLVFFAGVAVGVLFTSQEFLFGLRAAIVSLNRVCTENSGILTLVVTGATLASLVIVLRRQAS
jgi:hypothetical protein